MEEIDQRLEDSSGRRQMYASIYDLLGNSMGNPGPDKNNPTPVVPLPPSKAKDEWLRQKHVEGQRNSAMDNVMDMIGLEEVKEHLLSVKAKVDAIGRQGSSLDDECFNVALLGNPGTGKTTVARQYGQFLHLVGAIPNDAFVEVSGSKLASLGVKDCETLFNTNLSKGGTFFIDDAYQLTSGNNAGGRAVLDYLLPKIEEFAGKIVFIVAGYKKEMETFFAHNSGLPSRFPMEIRFKDYEDSELQQIFKKKVADKYKGRMKVEGGLDGPYVRIVARRIGRGRGHEGFGNARAVYNTFAKITNRQARRLQEGRRADCLQDDLLLTKQDLLGPVPGAVLENNDAWKKLQSLTGLDSVKQSVEDLFHTIAANYERELAEKPIIEYSLNKVFLGNPGTGKTTVAKLYGQILADLGFLSNGDVIVKNASDFVNSVVGGSEEFTKGILASTVGKVLVIDEAYMLGGNISGDANAGGSGADQFKAAVVDTIVSQVHNVPGDDRCILLLGYKEPMEKMFRNMNPGFARRFPIESAFQFDDYTDDELQKILELKLTQSGLEATTKAKDVVRECLGRARNRANFGNAGEIDNILTQAKLNLQKRRREGKTRSMDVLEPVDIDPYFDRDQHASANCRKLFEGFVGCEHLVDQLEKYQNIAKSMKELKKDPRDMIPFSFLFRGPAGTGKSSAARRMGQVYYDMGFLSVPEVVETSTTDLLGQYVGHTGPKTEKAFERALGKVLFIDEAYRLLNGQFGKEALDQLVDSMTKPRFYNRLVVIIAGYETDMDQLMAQNPGLSSRFSKTVSFKAFGKDQCWDLLQKRIAENDDIDSDVVQDPRPWFHAMVVERFNDLSAQPGWGNARDVETIVSKIAGAVFAGCSSAGFAVTEQIVLSELRSLLDERRGQTPSPRNKAETNPSLPTAVVQHDVLSMLKTQVKTSTKQAAAAPAEKKEEKIECRHSPGYTEMDEEGDVSRDANVSDEVWEQLKLDKAASIRQKQKVADINQQIHQARSALIGITSISGKPKRKWQLTLELQQLNHKKQALEHEEAVQKKLRVMGVCELGFQWIKQSSGYRCAGGSHFVSNMELS